MPLVGVALGAPLAHAIGDTADYLAAAAVIGIGAWMLLHGESEDDEEKAGRLVSARGVSVLGRGISISLDELAIGFSLGVMNLPLIPVIIAIGAQAFARRPTWSAPGWPDHGAPPGSRRTTRQHRLDRLGPVLA